MTIATDQLIVGAGPQGLAVAAFTKRYQGVTSTVVDPGGWLANWNDQFARLRIPELDSPLGAHPHPDLTALTRYMGMPAEARTDPSNRPPVEVFRAFCEATAAEFGLSVDRRRIVDIIPEPDGVRALADDGTEYRAHDVVLATNPHRAVVPEWAQRFADVPAFIHSSQLDLRRLPVAGRSVLVVGGGLTATQVAVRLDEGGADVTLVTRSPLKSHEQLAFDPRWNDAWRMERFYATTSPEERLEIARTGHQPSAPRATIDELDARGVRIGEGVEVSGATWNGETFDIELNGRKTLEFDLVIAATGVRPDLENAPVIQSVLRAVRPRFVQGYPVLNDDLSIPGTRVHVAGSSTALQTGPWAYYIFGGRMSAERLQPPSAPRGYLDPRPAYQGAGVA